MVKMVMKTRIRDILNPISKPICPECEREKTSYFNGRYYCIHCPEEIRKLEAAMMGVAAVERKV